MARYGPGFGGMDVDLEAFAFIITLLDKWEPNKDEREIIGVIDPLFLWRTDDGTDNSTDDAGNSSLDLDVFDVTTHADSAWIRISNTSGNSKTVRGAAIRGKPIIRLSGDAGWIHDDFVDYEDIYRNGERKFELGNNYVCTFNQTNQLADFHWKNFRAKRHIFAVSMVGTRYQFSPGEWYLVQIGGAGETEHINSLCECYGVQIERGVGELGTTIVTFREVYESWSKDSNSLARIIAGGNPANMPDYGRILVASSTHLGSADYYCEGTSDEDQINAAINELAGVDGGFVELTEGTYYTNGTIVLADNIVLMGKGWNTIIEKNGAYHGISLTGSGGSEYVNIALRDFKITRNASDTDTNDLINLVYVDNVIIENIYCYNSYNHSIYLSNCDKPAISNSHIDTCVGHGIIVTGSKSIYARILGNHVNTGGNNSGIYILTIDDTTIAGNISINNKYNISVYGGSKNTITNNICEDGSNTGILILENSDNNIISSNICENNTIYGIRIDTVDCNRNVITGNRATGNGTNFSDAGTDTFFETATDGDPLNDFN